jgi:hypothetical protein
MLVKTHAQQHAFLLYGLWRRDVLPSDWEERLTRQLELRLPGC